MNIFDYFTIMVIIGGCTTILGWWLKARLDTSIKHEYDKILEGFKSELKRSEVLLTERLAAYKSISPYLLSLRRYCHARSAEFRNESEFEPRTDSLNEKENLGLLSHQELISRALDDIELLISPNTRSRFDDLFQQMGMGFNLELWLSTGDQASELLSNAHELYDLVGKRVNDVLAELYSDLNLPASVTPPTNKD